MHALILSRELPDLYRNWGWKSTAGGLDDNPGWIVFLYYDVRVSAGGSVPLSSRSASAIRPTNVQHKHPFNISWTPSIFDSFANSLSTGLSIPIAPGNYTFEIPEFVLE